MNRVAQASSVTPASRRQSILDELALHGERSIDQLATAFGVSGMTIRRDLQELAESGRVVRTHGGAAPASRVSFEFRFLERAREAAEGKFAIARTAAGLVNDGESVMLDSGTTTLAIARQLRDRPGLTVITTSLPIASELFGCDGVRLLLLGGQLQRDSPDLVGPVTLQNLQALHADVAMLGVDGVDEAGGLYTASTELAPLLTGMANACERVYAVADHGKLGRRSLVRFAHARTWAGLITDFETSPAMVRKLRRAGVEVVQPNRKDRSP